ncbi:MAG: ATP-binding protein, partial [Candidatus Cloacimonadaceae bacterium]|nr:ATP-binding protein [Candidatus Cloacimonadaceae bacterium]
PFKFEQVFINLVSNSLRYTESGAIRISTKDENDQWSIEVRDTGCGIDPAHLPRIFERFYVADPSRNKANGGTGLGLAIVKHIIMRHQGKIEVSSLPGKGTTFSITLPKSLNANAD